MKYSFIISGMTWSYSRLTTFEACPYQFFLKYIQPQEERPLFYSEYGSVMHELIRGLLTSSLSKPEAIDQLIGFFASGLPAGKPAGDLPARFLRQGIQYIEGFSPPPGTVLSTEQEVFFRVGGFPFTGFIDCLMKEANGLSIWDHKSHDLKPRVSLTKPRASDRELDSYLRQLYLYSIPIREAYREYPASLVFNCYRAGRVIREPYCKAALASAQSWAVETINRIQSEDTWRPHLDYFRCRYLCPVAHECEYFSLSGGGAH